MFGFRIFEFYNYLGKRQELSQKDIFADISESLACKKRRSKQFQSLIGGQVENLPFLILNQRSFT